MHTICPNLFHYIKSFSFIYFNEQKSFSLLPSFPVCTIAGKCILSNRSTIMQNVQRHNNRINQTKTQLCCLKIYLKGNLIQGKEEKGCARVLKVRRLPNCLLIGNNNSKYKFTIKGKQRGIAMQSSMCALVLACCKQFLCTKRFHTGCTLGYKLFFKIQ